MTHNSIRLLDDTADQFNLTGNKVKAAGYFGASNGQHTVALYINDFTGRIVVEASLANEPSEEDWFPIEFDGDAFIQYPLDPNNPSGSNGDTGTFFKNFVGNFVWVRARVDRTYLQPISGNPDLGSVKKILLNF